MQTDKKTDPILTELKNIHSALRTEGNRMWDIADIASFFGYTETYTRNKLVKVDGFPRPREMPTGGKRWIASEVREYAKKLPRR